MTGVCVGKECMGGGMWGWEDAALFPPPKQQQQQHTCGGSNTASTSTLFSSSTRPYKIPPRLIEKAIAEFTYD